LRVLAVHTDVIVVLSGMWQTTATAVRSGEEGFLIDSPVLPDELDALPAVLEQSGFPVSGLLCTHADWDHLLGRLAFPEASLGTGESSAARLSAELGRAQRDLRAFDERHYIKRERPLALSAVQGLPVPGRLSIGAEEELELFPAGGHTSDGTAFWIPWARVLVCGDYLSPVEIPMISDGGALEAYGATLERLAPLLERAEAVIPGHGGPLSAERAQQVLGEDLAYVDRLRRADADTVPLPAGRRTPEQQRIHAENVSHAAAGG
jgi:glyoxylase-like metal-dependent hydrolase (beta-lactamase superfamily II)